MNKTSVQLPTSAQPVTPSGLKELTQKEREREREREREYDIT